MRPVTVLALRLRLSSCSLPLAGCASEASGALEPMRAAGTSNLNLQVRRPGLARQPGLECDLGRRGRGHCALAVAGPWRCLCRGTLCTTPQSACHVVWRTAHPDSQSEAKLVLVRCARKHGPYCFNVYIGPKSPP